MAPRALLSELVLNGTQRCSNVHQRAQRSRGAATVTEATQDANSRLGVNCELRDEAGLPRSCLAAEEDQATAPAEHLNEGGVERRQQRLTLEQHRHEAEYRPDVPACRCAQLSPGVVDTRVRRCPGPRLRTASGGAFRAVAARCRAVPPRRRASRGPALPRLHREPAIAAPVGGLPGGARLHRVAPRLPGHGTRWQTCS